MADDLERLTALIDANDTALMNAFKRMQDGWDKSNSNFNRNASAMEKRYEAMSAKMAAGLSNLTKGLAAGVSFVAIERFLGNLTETASALKSTSDTLKVGTDELQAWAVIAGRAHVDAATFNADLETFGKNMGKAVVEGGPLRKLFTGLGVDLKGSVTDGVYKFADAIQKTRDPQQQVALVTAGWGKSAAALTPILAQGGSALRAQVQQLKDAGYVISSEGIEKIDALGNSWEDLKRQFNVAGAGIATGFMEQFSTFAGTIGSNEFKSAMKEFGADLGVAAGWLVKMAPYLPAIGGAIVGARIAGAPGAVIGAVVASSAVGPKAATTDEEILQGKIADLKKETGFWKKPLVDTIFGDSDETKAKLAELAALEAQLKKLQSAVKPADGGAKPPGGTLDHSDLLNNQTGTQAKFLSDLQYSLAQQQRNTQQQSDQGARAAGLAAEDARADSIKAQDEALVSMTQGASDFYDVQRKVIDEIAQIDISSINARRDAELQALNEREQAETQAIDDRAKKQLGDLRAQELGAAAAALATKKIMAAAEAEKTAITSSALTQRIDLNNEAASKISGIQAKQAADTKQSMEAQLHTQQDLIDASDALKNGVLSIGTAAQHGFKSAGEAAASFLQQLADMIIQINVLRPIAEYLFGSANTGGGGAASGVTKSITGGNGGLISQASSWIADLFSFRDGGVMTSQGSVPMRRYAKGGVASSPQMAEFGEGSQNEAYVPLPDGRRIPVRGTFNMNVPNMAGLSGGTITNVTQQFDLSGAVVTEDLLDQVNRMSRSESQKAVALYDQHVLPARVKKIARDPRAA